MSGSGFERLPPAPSVSVRVAPIGLDDWAAVRHVHALAFERLAGPYLDTDEIVAFKARVATPEYTEDLQSENLIGAWVEQELVGTAGWRPTDDAGTSARITSIFVHPMFARLGIGSHLLAEAERSALRAGFSALAARATPNAVSFFELNGYEVSSHGVSHIASENYVPIAFMRKLAGQPEADAGANGCERAAETGGDGEREPAKPLLPWPR